MRLLKLGLLLTAGCVLLLGADAPTPTPADDLKTLQGDWKISLVVWKDRLPSISRLNEEGQSLKIEENRLMVDGKVVGTLTNDLPEVPQAKEVGWHINRLVLLTLPDGKGLWCSYRIEPTRVQLTYPHTTSCHRGSGQIVYLERPKKADPPQ